MAPRKMTDDRKYQVVMDLLHGDGSVSEIYNRYGVSQTYLYKRRDRALGAVADAVKDKKERLRIREERWAEELAKAEQ